MKNSKRSAMEISPRFCRLGQSGAIRLVFFCLLPLASAVTWGVAIFGWLPTAANQFSALESVVEVEGLLLGIR